jgi:hypothetical protein
VSTDARLDALIERLRDDLRLNTDVAALTLLAAAAEVWLGRDVPDADAVALRDASSRLVLKVLGASDHRIEYLKATLTDWREPESLIRRQ